MNLIDPDDYDPSFPGEGDYLDWLMLRADVDKYTPKMNMHLIEMFRKLRPVFDSGKFSKSGTSTEAVKALSKLAIQARPPEKPVARRKV